MTRRGDHDDTLSAAGRAGWAAGDGARCDADRDRAVSIPRQPVC